MSLQKVSSLLAESKTEKAFADRLYAAALTLERLFQQLYQGHPAAEAAYEGLLKTIIQAHQQRSKKLQAYDQEKAAKTHWYLSNEIAGMSLYVDRFAGSLKQMPEKLDYLEELGINFLHLMPIFESPANESDGGYAVSDFRKVDARFGNLKDLESLVSKMHQRKMYLMLDIVLNHTSHKHAWAEKAKAGDPFYKDFFYFYQDRRLPDQFEQTMPEIFPESAPGSFTYVPELQEWVMTVFHNYQWDLNYTNPHVLVAMLDTIFFYANLGVDILRIDAPAFIWKRLGTTCQNLPEAHTLLRIIKCCVAIATPGMALLGEAIVAPAEIMKYFGTDEFVAKECDFAYNATHMALQWDMLATKDTRVMLAAQEQILRKPYGTSWITYTRCHDDIGLGYDDSMIAVAGFNAFEHRRFLKDYYSGSYQGSPASGALFSVNPKTNDARISGTLASLCGLEKALASNDAAAIEDAINKILLMQAHSFFLGGIPMLFYGDEVGYTNDYSYLEDVGKSYDNRWMHRPIIDWEKNARRQQADTIEARIFNGTKKLLQIRKQLAIIADSSNLTWVTPHNIHVATYVRKYGDERFFGAFNFNDAPAYLTWYAFKEHQVQSNKLFDHWSGQTYTVGDDREHLIIPSHGFCLLTPA